jgi:hypothetical protein
VKRRPISVANPGKSWETSILKGIKSFAAKMVMLGCVKAGVVLPPLIAGIGEGGELTEVSA